MGQQFDPCLPGRLGGLGKRFAQPTELGRGQAFTFGQGGADR
jgi:hypothetical protein